MNVFYHPVRFGGVERVVQVLAETQAAAGHDVTVLCVGATSATTPRTVGDVRVQEVALRNVYPLLPLEGRNPVLKPIWHMLDSANPAMQRPVDAVLGDVRPDVVHTHNLTGFSTLLWRTVARRRIPIVHTLHDYYLLCLRSTLYHRDRSVAPWHLPCAPFARIRMAPQRHVSAVVGVSASVLGNHRDAGAFAQTPVREVIGNPNSIDVASDISRASASPGGPLRLGFLGRLEPNKGVMELLAALRALAPGTFSLDIAGRGDQRYEAGIRAEAQAIAGVRVNGFVAARDFLPLIDVLVVPSRSPETFGMVILEAWTFGVPVIVANRGGMPELLRDERTGWIYEPDDPGALHRLLTQLSANPNVARERADACRRAAAAFAPSRVTQSYLDLYAQVISDGPSR